MFNSPLPWCPPGEGPHLPPPTESKRISTTFGSLLDVPFPTIKLWKAPYVRVNIRMQEIPFLAGLEFIVKVGSGNYQREYKVTGLGGACITFDIAATGGVKIEWIDMAVFPGYAQFLNSVVDYQVVPISYPQHNELVPHIVHVEDIDDSTTPKSFTPVLSNPGLNPVSVNCYTERVSLALERGPAGAGGDVSIFGALRSASFTPDSLPLVSRLAYSLTSGAYANGVDVRGGIFGLLGWTANGLGAGTVRATLTEWIRTY